MPYDVRQTDQCPTSKPWGVFKIDGEALVACHVSKEKGQAQIAAIHASEGKSYTPDEIRAMKQRIIAAWKDKIDKAGPPSAGKSLEELRVELKAAEDSVATLKSQVANLEATEIFERFQRNMRKASA